MENKELEVLKEKYADFIATLGDEDKAKVDACKTAEELIALAQNAEGELPDDIAETVAGGKPEQKKKFSDYKYKYFCPNCKHVFGADCELADLTCRFCRRGQLEK